MKKLDPTRRALLGTSLAGAASLLLGGCAGGRSATRMGSAAAAHSMPEQARSPDSSVVAVVRTVGSPSYAAALAAAIEGAGGLGFIRPGQSVLLKPALNSSRPYPATTDPETIRVVGALVLKAGGVPFVADRTMFMRPTQASLDATGISAAARELGIACRALDDEPAVLVHHELAAAWSDREVPIYRAVAEADHLITLCTPRTHRIADFTMSMKNLVGIVQGSARLGMHGPFALKDRLAEISLVARPSLAVMDGRDAFTAGGPDSGDLAHPGFIAASTDPLALDAVGLGFLRLAGTVDAIAKQSIWRLPVMRRAMEIGIGAASAKDIRLVGLSESDETRLRAELA